MPVLETRGAASARGYGLLSGQGGSGAVIEDVFSTWLYTGNGSTQTITNGIDLSTQGGLVWIKPRSVSGANRLVDSNRGYANQLQSDTTNPQGTATPSWSFSALSSGWSINTTNTSVNNTGDTYASWTFRKAPKFFDVVTYTGNGSNRTIAHSLGSVPGCIIVKRTDTTADWQVYHRSLANTEYLVLNLTDAKATGTDRWNSTTADSTVFSLGTNAAVNASGGTYVAYLFAHDAGGFGASGTDNVISCGSYTGNGSSTGPTVTLGYEPQWLMVKNASGTGNWNIIDNMRGMPVGSADAFLEANTSDAEATADWVTPTATGFQIASTSSEVNTNSSTYIYVAIRRGPMRTPTSGTEVYNANLVTDGASGTQAVSLALQAPDLIHFQYRSGAYGGYFGDRLRGFTGASNYQRLITYDTSVEQTANEFYAVTNTGLTHNNFNLGTIVYHLFRRAPGFFDVVCYTGTGANRTVNHNLGVVPELMIVKRRDTAADWWVYDTATGNTKYQVLNSTATPTTSSTAWNNTTPTSSVFTVGTGTPVNASAGTYVAYLFATVAGVSKVGSYTGNGSSQTINCGFTGGARFVLIKATSTTGDWLVADSARGIVAGNDPYLELNTTNTEVTGEDWLDTDSTGFVVNEVSGSNANTNGVSYIFLAIA
jgi:hypothetical protein